MITDDAAAALARLDADLAVATATREQQDLRRRAVGAYRNALAYAAGRPDDPRWRFLARTVASFAARVPAGFARSHHTAAAVARLNALVAENLG